MILLVVVVGAPTGAAVVVGIVSCDHFIIVNVIVISISIVSISILIFPQHLQEGARLQDQLKQSSQTLEKVCLTERL